MTGQAEGLDRRRQVGLGAVLLAGVADAAARGAEDHRGRDPAGDLGGVVERAAGERLARRRPPRGRRRAALRRARGRRGRLDPPDRLAAEHAALLVGGLARRRRAPRESISASAAASGWRRSTAELGAAGDRGDDPRLQRELARRRHAAVPTAIRSTASAVSAAARPASRRGSIGVVPAWAAWPGEGEPWRSTPAQPETAEQDSPSGLEHRALLDVELEVGADPAPAALACAGAGRARPRSRPARRRSRRRRRRAAPRQLAGSSVPASAELPNRLRPKREPSSSAKSIERRGRAAAGARLRPGAEHAERRPSRRARRRASRRRGPSRGGSRPPSAGASRSLAREPWPTGFPASSPSASTPSSASFAASHVPRRRHSSSPADPPGRRRAAAGEPRRARAGRRSRRAASIAAARPRPLNRCAPGAAPGRGSGRRRRRA